MLCTKKYFINLKTKVQSTSKSAVICQLISSNNSFSLRKQGLYSAWICFSLYDLAIILTSLERQPLNNSNIILLLPKHVTSERLHCIYTSLNLAKTERNNCKSMEIHYKVIHFWMCFLLKNWLSQQIRRRGRNIIEFGPRLILLYVIVFEDIVHLSLIPFTKCIHCQICLCDKVKAFISSVQFYQFVRPSLRPSVRLSVCLSVLISTSVFGTLVRLCVRLCVHLYMYIHIHHLQTVT